MWHLKFPSKRAAACLHPVDTKLSKADSYPWLHIDQQGLSDQWYWYIEILWVIICTCSRTHSKATAITSESVPNLNPVWDPMDPTSQPGPRGQSNHSETANLDELTTWRRIPPGETKEKPFPGPIGPRKGWYNKPSSPNMTEKGVV